MSPVVVRIVKVVPRLVVQRAAPAANAWSGFADKRGMSTYDSPIGTQIPVKATTVENMKFACNEEKEVERPPGTSVSVQYLVPFSVL